MTAEIGRIVWLLGPPAAGKTTLSRELAHILRDTGRAVAILDGDEVRHRLHRDLGFSSFDRLDNVTRTAALARLLSDQSIDVLVAMITPERDHQASVRRILPDVRFIYCHAALSALEERDPKGHYARARDGKLAGFTGIDAPFETPREPFLDVRTDLHGVHDCVAAILRELMD